MPPRSPRRTMQVLPEQSLDADLELSRDYNTAAIVGSAWTSLQSDIPKLPWEQDFWSGFLDPTKSAMDLFTKVTRDHCLSISRGMQLHQLNQKSSAGWFQRAFQGCRVSSSTSKMCLKKAGKKREMLCGRSQYADEWQFWTFVRQVMSYCFTRCSPKTLLLRKRRSW